MLNILLQSAETAEVAQKFSADSLKAGRQQLIDTLTSTPPDELVRQLAQDGIHFGLKVLAALAIYIVGAWVIKIIRRAVRKGMEKKKRDAALTSFTESLLTITLWVLVIILAISALGVNTTSLAALLAAGGMAIGVALGGTVQNFAGGIMLLIFKPFKAGDLIEAQGFTGIVTEVNMVSTKLTTLDNRIVILPNGALSNGNINNISALPIRRVETKISLGYGTDFAAAREAILEILREDDRILDSTTPGAADPFVVLSRLGESSLEITVRAWVVAADYWGVLFDFNERAYKELPERGFRFDYPQLDVHIKQQ